MADDKRLIEDYLPIVAISAEASREKSVRKGHDSFWLYVVWNPLHSPDALPVMIRNPAKHLEHAAKPVVSARFYDISADAIQAVVEQQNRKT